MNPQLHQANITELERLGYQLPVTEAPSTFRGLMKMSTTSSALSDMVGLFQEMVGVPVTGSIDAATQVCLTYRVNAAGHKRMCSCPDYYPDTKDPTQSMTEWTARWPKMRINIGYNFTTIPGLSATEVKEAFQIAVDHWRSVCGLDLALTPYNQAHIGCVLHNHSGNTLADSPLAHAPFNAGSHIQRYDSTRNWLFWMFVAVIIHELGHAFGWFHTPANQPASILAPFLNEAVQRLTEWDIEQAVKGYGPPLNKPTDPDPPKPPGDGSNILKVMLGDTQIARFSIFEGVGNSVEGDYIISNVKRT